MSLSKASVGLLPRYVLSFAARRAGSNVIAPKPKEAAKKLVMPATESGYFKYERDYSRDKRYSNPQKPGDTAMRFLVRKLGHAYEVYPLFFLTGCWVVLFFFTTYYSFEKIEVWFDRSTKTAPWSWERVRDNYWKKPTLLFDSTGVTHQRLEIMEALQDEMYEAAKKQGKL
ncbi:Hypothetical protein SRAE_2000323000 [Strongyloides ratti]|uniref:Uncharacterized protein n=1 Tax=Strongyloides ratti TaxID=34506 RepID=A0A090MZA1_STRRB|nr:Hypothetical protein SRAE_2000323000 [Strongyloides ratti]CEF68574.1 Hypothetical protein SRAE_2000323000 [Strongyloides ratti]